MSPVQADNCQQSWPMLWIRTGVDYCAGPINCRIRHNLRRLQLRQLCVPLLAAALALGLGGCARPLLDDNARQQAAGQFVHLSDGQVHYQLTGPTDGRTVVLVHGLATPSFIWDKNVSALVAAGFRVLRYDHFGRGFSDRPKIRYDRDLYDRQLLELLQRLDIEQPVDVVGLSMGGAVAVVFTDRHPEWVNRLCLLAPAGMPLKLPWTIRLAKVPLLGELLMALVGDKVVEAGVMEAFVNPGDLEDFEQQFRLPLRYQGFHHALLSTLRHMDMNNMIDTYKRVGKQSRPTLLVWGSKDQVLPFDNYHRVMAAMPHTEFHPLDGAGHNLNYENPELVNPILTEFLSREVEYVR